MAVHDSIHYYSDDNSIICNSNNYYFSDDSFVSNMPNSRQPNSDNNNSIDKILLKTFGSFVDDLHDSYSANSENEDYSKEDLFAKVNIK